MYFLISYQNTTVQYPYVSFLCFLGHMFNTGLPPLDRQGLFPSHGSILDPLQTSSFSPLLGAGSKKPQSAPYGPPPPHSDSFRHVSKSPKLPPPTVNLASESG